MWLHDTAMLAHYNLDSFRSVKAGKASSDLATRVGGAECAGVSYLELLTNPGEGVTIWLPLSRTMDRLLDLTTIDDLLLEHLLSGQDITISSFAAELAHTIDNRLNFGFAATALEELLLRPLAEVLPIAGIEELIWALHDDLGVSNLKLLFAISRCDIERWLPGLPSQYLNTFADAVLATTGIELTYSQDSLARLLPLPPAAATPNAYALELECANSWLKENKLTLATTSKLPIPELLRLPSMSLTMLNYLRILADHEHSPLGAHEAAVLPPPTS